MTSCSACEKQLVTNTCTYKNRIVEKCVYCGNEVSARDKLPTETRSMATGAARLNNQLAQQMSEGSIRYRLRLDGAEPMLSRIIANASRREDLELIYHCTGRRIDPSYETVRNSIWIPLCAMWAHNAMVGESIGHICPITGRTGYPAPISPVEMGAFFKRYLLTRDNINSLSRDCTDGHKLFVKVFCSMAATDPAIWEDTLVESLLQPDSENGSIRYTYITNYMRIRHNTFNEKLIKLFVLSAREVTTNSIFRRALLEPNSSATRELLAVAGNRISFAHSIISKVCHTLQRMSLENRNENVSRM